MNGHFARCVLLAIFAASPVQGYKVNAVSEASLFLRSHEHTPPNTDELAELKGVNPEAYALVKALLMKKSLGLLDPSHPTASFAKSSQQHQLQASEQGPEAFAKLTSPEELRAHAHGAPTQLAQVDVPYAAVQASGHHDFLGWKPHSADDDEAMVNNVLGAVAELKGRTTNLVSTHSTVSQSPLEMDEKAFDVGAASTVAAAEPVATPVAPVAAASTPVMHRRHKNSYLDGLDLTGDMPKAETNKQDGAALRGKKPSQVQSTSSNLLASFSWGDDSKQQRQEEQEPILKVTAKDANLMSWLGVVSKEPVLKPAPATPVAVRSRGSNAYLMDLA